MSIMLRTSDTKNLTKFNEAQGHWCGCCGQWETEIIRLNRGINEEGKPYITRTQNFAWICTQEGCVMRIDLKKVKTWIRV